MRNATTKQSYFFDDPAMGNSVSNTSKLFYRIRQVDLDGKSTLSLVISVKLPKQDNVLVYPNPVAKGHLPGVFIRDGHNVRAQVYTTSGQLLWEKQLSGGYNILPFKGNVSGLILMKIIYADGRVEMFKVLME